MADERKAILELSSKVIEDQKSLRKFLKGFKLKEEKRRWLVNIWTKKMLLNKERRKSYVKFVDVIEKSQNKHSFKFKNLKSLQASLDQKNNIMVNSLTETFIALEIQNQAWANSSLEKILYMAPKRMIFDSIDWKKDDPLKLRFMSSFYYFMENTLKKMENKKLAKIFVNYMGSIVQSPEMKDIISSWGANWSLTIMRELTTSITYGKKYLSAWVTILYERVRNVELNQLINKSIDPDIMDLKTSDYLWVLKDVNPVSEKIKAYIDYILKENRNSSESHFQYMLVSLIDNESIKRIISSQLPKYSRPQFQVKRNFYLKLLEDSSASSFAIYNLLKLGDRSDDYLWWLVL